MKCSLGPAVAIVAVAITASAFAGEPTPARFGSGNFGGVHARPVSAAIAGDDALPANNYAAGNHASGNYAADIDAGGAYAPGSCDYQAPCVNGLWNGYVKRPLRCNLGGGCGCNAGGCNTCRHTYSGFGASGFGLGRIFACQSPASDCDSCGATVAAPASCGCDSAPFAPCGVKPCRSCGLKQGGLGRFWNSCFGDGGYSDCGCSDASFVDNNDGPAPRPAAHPADDVINTLRAPVPPADNGPAPAAIIPAPKRTDEAPAELSLPKEPAPQPAPEAAPPADEKGQREVGPDPEARRLRPTYRGFSSFGR